MDRHAAGPKRLQPPRPNDYATFSVAPLAPSLGGLVTGIDLRTPLSERAFGELEHAWREFKVLLFRNQPLTARQHAELAARFGTLTDDQLVATPDRNPVDCLVEFTRDATTPGLENGWHADGTFRVQPTAGTWLRAIEVPPIGGDTVFADMAAAYDNLPEDVRVRIDSLVAVHDWSMGAYAAKYGEKLAEYRELLPPVRHPVVLVHPVTGRQTLFVNRFFTKCIEGLPPDEGDRLLDRLCRQCDVLEYQLRWRWEPGSIAFWDNLAVQHYGVNDYHPQRRTMARATFFQPAVCWQGREGAQGPGEPMATGRAGRTAFV